MAQATVEQTRTAAAARASAAELRRLHDEELVARLVGTEGGCGVCGEVFTPAGKVAHLAADRTEAIAELGGPVGVAARNAAARIVAREAAATLSALERRAIAAGYGDDVGAWIDGYMRRRTSAAIGRPGPARTAFAAGWIARSTSGSSHMRRTSTAITTSSTPRAGRANVDRSLDERKLAHEANLDGNHDELDTEGRPSECGACTNVSELELRALWGDR